MSWYSKIEATLFTQIQYMLKKKYPKLNCVTNNSNITPSKFPTMYFHEEQEEVGQDLTKETVKAVNSTVYVK